MAKSSAIQVRAGDRKPKSASPKRLLSVTFEPAEGGVISRTRHGSSDYDPDDTVTTIHPTADHAAAHVMTTMAGCFEGKGSGNKPASGKSK